MAAQVISLMSRTRPAASVSRDWTQREIAEFYRVESALIQAGLELESERGLSDEGDPWFAFCRVDTGEVFIHFARENGRYVVDGGPFGAAARGNDFSELVRELIARHPLATTRRSGSNVFLHPAALLIALVGACFFHSGQAKAAETAEGHAARAATEASRRHAITLAGGDAPPASDRPQTFVALDAAQAAAIITGVLIALRAPPAEAAAPADAHAAIVATADALSALSATITFAAASEGPRPVVAGSATPEGREVLAVIAVLHDLFRLQPTAAAPVEGVVAPLVHAGLPEAGANTFAAAPVEPPSSAGPPTSAPPLADRSLVVVHLSVADLPHVEAVALIQGAGVLKVIGDDHIDRLDHLPAFIADAISHGEQVDLTNTTPTVPPPSHIQAETPHGLDGGQPPPAAPPEQPHVDTPTNQDQTPPASDPPVLTPNPSPAPDSTPAPHDPAVTQTAPAPTDLPPPPPPSPPQAPTPDAGFITHNPDIDAAVVRFAALVHAGMIISGSEIVIYDPQVLQPLKAGDVLDSVTFHFTDGSSISLLGTAAELHDLHGLH